MNPILGNAIMMGVGALLIYLGIVKKYEPLLLVPMGFGAILVNIPYSGLMEPGGLMRAIYDLGIESEFFPCLLFVGIGAMCDFGTLLERPWLLIFAAAGQLGIFIALMIALLLGFSPLEACCIGIIGAMDGPTAIYITSKYAPHLLGAVSVCAYSYMSCVPVIQVPLSRILTTRNERLIRMKYEPAAYPKVVRILFPIIVTLVTCLLAPLGTPLMGSLMLGNLLKESGVTDRLSKTASEALNDIITLLLAFTIGGTMEAGRFLTLKTLMVFGLGLVAFISAISCGILFAKAVAFVTRGKVNPLLGACGVSAFPMAARTSHMIAREEDPDNWLLMHAIATNSGGQIGSVVAGGVILTFAPRLLGLT